MCGHRRYEYVSRSRDESVRRTPHMRASQAEREEVVERLRVHTGEGRLEIDELEERVEAAYGAKTRGELAELLDDLPEPQPTRSQRATRQFAAIAGSLPLILAIAVFVFAPASIAWLGWPLLAWWFFARPGTGRSCAPRRHATRTRDRRTVVV
jgi:Domain of unknown function (DUF1707)